MQRFYFLFPNYKPFVVRQFISSLVYQMLSGFLVKRLDNTYMFFHPSFREWLMRRDEGESTKFLCDLRLGHAAIAYRLSRLQAPLDGDKALELGHHILKAHVYRGVAPCWPSRDLQVKSPVPHLHF